MKDLQIISNVLFISQSSTFSPYATTANEIAVHKAVEIGFINPSRIQIVTIYLYQQNTDEKKKRTSFYNWFFFWIKIRNVI